MTVTMKDIARGLGLSTVTISKVLRSNPGIAEKTREHVLQRVEELNHHPNFMASLGFDSSNIASTLVDMSKRHHAPDGLDVLTANSDPVMLPQAAPAFRRPWSSGHPENHG